MADAAAARIETSDEDGNSDSAGLATERDDAEDEGKELETSQAVTERFEQQVRDLLRWVNERGTRAGSFGSFEVALILKVFALARTLVQLFLVLREERRVQIA